MSEDEHQATSTEVTLSVSAEIAPTNDDNSSPHKNDIVEREEEDITSPESVLLAMGPDSIQRDCVEIENEVRCNSK